MFSKTKDIPFSPIKRIQAEAEKIGAVSLAQGIPRFLPPLAVRRAAITAIEEGKTDFYGPPQGIPELRRQISEWHLSREKTFYDPEKEVLITAGALQGMGAALAALLSPGDELIVPTPSYFPFLNIPKIFGVTPVFVPLEPPNWRLDVSELKQAITPRTKGIIICHPNNPTGTVYTRAELEEIAAIAEKHNLWIFADEVYRFFVDPQVAYTPLGDIKSVRPRLVRLMSFSKSFSLSGWRVGYLLADSPAAVEILKSHEMFTTAGASLPAQYAALAALGDFPDLPQRFAQILLGRRERMRRRLQKLEDYFEFKVPEGAYYFFVKPKGVRDAAVFARRLLEEAGVAVVPGSAFGPSGEDYLRLSFAAKEGEIEEAFDRMEKHLLRKGERMRVPNWEEWVSICTGVTDDSRQVREGSIFVAVAVDNFDGHDFAAAAIRNGAALVVGERDLGFSKYRRVANSRAALGQLCAAWYHHPSRRLKTIAVTGTDGKTTTSHLLGAILNRAGIKTEVLSTISVPGFHTTTPPAPILQKLLAEAAERGSQAAVVEVTSHGIAQERIAGTGFQAAVLTNVTPEHLDYHETF
ncbi:MAG: aminotransferase class I/II-fold pyridoxal phosphate-dependent enzyme, partial [Patescibacteria group bacterium]